MFDKQFEITQLAKAICSHDAKMQAAIKTQPKQQLGEILMQVDECNASPLLCALLPWPPLSIIQSLPNKAAEYREQYNQQRDLFIDLFFSLDNLDIQAQILKHTVKKPMIEYSFFHGAPHILAAVVKYAPDTLERFLSLIKQFDKENQHAIWTQAQYRYQIPILTKAFYYNFPALKKLLTAFKDLPTLTKAHVLHQVYHWSFDIMKSNNEVQHLTVLVDFIRGEAHLKLLLESINADEEEPILRDMLLNQERENTVLLETMLKGHFKSSLLIIERIRTLQNPNIRKMVLEQTAGIDEKFLRSKFLRLNVLMCLLWSFKHAQNLPSLEDKTLLLNKLLEVIYLLDDSSKKSIFNPAINFYGMNPLLIAIRHCPEMAPTLLPEIMKFSLEIQQDIIANFTPNDWSELINSMNKDQNNRSILVKFILSTNPTNPITATSAELFSYELLLPLYQAGDITLQQTIQEVFAEQVRNVRTIGQIQIKNSLLALMLIKHHNLTNSDEISLEEKMTTLIQSDEVDTITNLSHLLYHLYLKDTLKQIYPESDKSNEWKKVIKLQLEELRVNTKYPEILMALAMIADQEQNTPEKNQLLSDLRKLGSPSHFSFHKADPIAQAFFNNNILPDSQDPREVGKFISSFNKEILGILGIAGKPSVRQNNDKQTELEDLTPKSLI